MDFVSRSKRAAVIFCSVYRQSPAAAHHSVKRHQSFFDEVQQCSDIVMAIKFLVDDGSYRAKILSGSLLGVESERPALGTGWLHGCKDMFPPRFLRSLFRVGV